MKKVMCFGAFDGLHPGHLDFFKQAKKLGDFLVVSVGTDKNVARIKGRPPLFSQDERVELIGQVKIVDEAVLGSEDDYWGHIKSLAPDVICLGYDQWASEAEVKSELAKIGMAGVRVVRLKPHKIDRAKSTLVKANSVEF